MKTFQEIWLEKISGEDDVSKKEVIHALKKHESRERPEDEEKEDATEQRVEKELGIEKWKEKKAASKVRAQASDVTNSIKPTLVVTFDDSNTQSTLFIQNLDKVLSSMSGIKNLQIKAFHTLKDSNTISQLKAPVSGITLFKGKERLGSLSHKSTEQDIRKFMEAHRKSLF